MILKGAAVIAILICGVGEAGFKERCANHIRSMYINSLPEVSLDWATEYLSTGALLNRKQGVNSARALAAAIFRPESALWRESAKKVMPIIRRDDEWMDSFLRASEIFFYGKTFQKKLKVLDRLLPKQGKILQMGGSGWVAGFFLTQPNRQMALVESFHARELARRRLVDYDIDRLLILPYDPNLMELRPKTYDAVLVFDAYLHHPKLSKVFDQYFEALKRGGNLILVEAVQETPKKFDEYVIDSITEGVQGGAPQNDFEVVFLSAVLSGKTAKSFAPPRSYPSSEYLRSTALEAGFVLEEQRDAPDEFHTIFVFSKP